MTRTDRRWLAGQAVLLLVAFVALPLTGGGAGRLVVAGAATTGYVVAAAGLAVGLAAMRRLGRQLVPQPTPVRGGRLVDDGIYGVVRHPIYLGLLLLIAGVVLRWLSLSGLLLLIAAFAFFDRKSAYEERLLDAAYPEYRDYRAGVRWKLLPGVR